MKYKLFSIGVIFSSLTLQAAAPSAQTQAPMDPNPSARYGTDSRSNWFVQGEAVWFKPLNDEVAQFQLQEVGNDNNSELKYFQNEFKPAYRLALGYNTCFDGWDVLFQFTGFDYKHNNTFLYDDSSVAPAVLREGSLSYKYTFNQGDLDLGRMYKISKHLKARPHVGVRGLWLTQEGSKYFTDLARVPQTTLNSDRKKLNGTLIGAEAGIDGIWMFSKQVSVYANATLATLVNSQKMTLNVSRPDLNYTDYFSTNYNSRIVLGYDFAIGLRWDMNFSNDDYHLGINLGYEHHSLVNVNSTIEQYSDGFYDNTGNQPRSFIERKKVPLLSEADFTLQGLAVGVRFDF